MNTFTAKDGDGANIEIAAHYDATGAIYYPVIGLQPTFPLVVQFVDSLGNGAGNTNLIGDYSLASTDFYTQVPSGEVWHIHKVVGSMRYTGALRAERFGDIELPNGIRWVVQKDAVESEFTLQVQGKNLGNHASFLGKAVQISEFGTGDNFASWDADFHENTGCVVELNGNTNDKFIIRVNDNHSDLNDHRYLVFGYKLIGS